VLGKLAVSQVLGIVAGYMAFEVLSELYGEVPLYFPLAAWLFTTLYVLAKL
jgi:hypothetical protein